MTARILTALLLLGIAPISAFADGSRLPNQDALAVARGDAFAATADDPAAIYYNPAGLGQLAYGEVEAGASIISPSSSYSGQAGSASTKSKTFTLPYLYVVEPVSALKGLVVGLGYYYPFGLSTEWPANGPFRTVATSNAITLTRTAFSIGYDFGNGILLGASIQDNSFKADLNRGLGYYPGDYFNYTGRADNAWSYNVGILWKPSPENSFAITYQSRTNFNLSGEATLSPPVNVSGPGTLSWVFPESFTLAYSYRPTREWNFEIDYDQTDWSVLKTITLESQATGPVPIAFDWKDSAYYEVGATRYLGNWLLSAGVTYSANSVNDNTWSPSTDDYSKWLFNVGVGYKTGPWDIETAFQWSPTVSRTINGSPPSAAGQTADGTYRNRVAGLMLQVGYHW
jgi:long-chain fatty acid transport protein